MFIKGFLSYANAYGINSVDDHNKDLVSWWYYIKMRIRSMIMKWCFLDDLGHSKSYCSNPFITLKLIKFYFDVQKLIKSEIAEVCWR